ncbi:MAG: type VI secretion system domain-containing protein, partial [Thermoanaerobaculia bacterium]
KLPQATAFFQKEMQAAPLGRERFIWKLELARICWEGGRPDLAAPQLESLDQEVARHGLEEWDANLAVEVVKLLWSCYSAASNREGSSEKALRMYERLCRLDLSAAMASDGRK